MCDSDWNSDWDSDSDLDSDCGSATTQFCLAFGCSESNSGLAFSFGQKRMHLNLFLHCFFIAQFFSIGFYMRTRIFTRGDVRPSVGWSVGPMVVPFVRLSVRTFVTTFLNSKSGLNELGYHA